MPAPKALFAAQASTSRVRLGGVVGWREIAVHAAVNRPRASTTRSAFAPQTASRRQISAVLPAERCKPAGSRTPRASAERSTSDDHTFALGLRPKCAERAVRRPGGVVPAFGRLPQRRRHPGVAALGT